jgi:hypothetical protein
MTDESVGVIRNPERPATSRAMHQQHAVEASPRGCAARYGDAGARVPVLRYRRRRRSVSVEALGLDRGVQDAIRFGSQAL